jgi:hypothetical protein
MRKYAIAAVLLLWPAGWPGVASQDAPAQEPTPAQVQSTVEGTIDIRQATQADADAWAAERADLVQRWRHAQARIEQLGGRRRLTADRLRGLEDRVAELERRLEESARLVAGLQDTLVTLLARLETHVAEDLPFLPDERGMRLEHLREELVRPEVEPSEKLRRLLEALQIEAQYGASAEVYQDRIAVGADTLFVDVLRLGRLSLFWRTPDGTRAGEYDRAGQRWVELPAGVRRPIGLAIEIAERRRPVELIALPLGRIRP